MSIWLQGLEVSAIGMLVVFIGLVLLIILISLIRSFSSKDKQSDSAAPALAAAAPVPQAPVHQGVDPKVVAAITAALTAYYEAQPGYTGGFIVRRIKRK